ncbi:protein phosphatase 1 regulatory subunit 7-like isoform X3 [Polyodon spathula]|uniref:protein phosphatase 1 regulatory subunit 7-like isoform X3 n=1 Tax=Polyodon spathula TaxID=7913 RepID=UPI001B7E8192|nr:protein phosphatase 1 regulatory subunit 7-like isoform X3 [Polyodon spathula]
MASVGEPQDMGVDRRVESGDDEGKKGLNRESDSAQQGIGAKEESPVDMETIILDPEAEVIENIENLSHLDSLFLGTNKITKLQNLDGLASLTVLSIQSNCITRIEGLQCLMNLRELYLSHNGIEVIEGLENNKKLTTLDIAANRIKKIENISHLTELQEFWMNDNQIENWGDLDELKNAHSLETVYLERNPLQKDPQYRRKIMLALPTVRQIDATFIRF